MLLYNFLAGEHALSNLSLRRMRISRIRELNDPFELLACNVGDAGIRRAVEMMRIQIDRQIGLLCFCEHWNDPLLWSHYAAKHSGMCFGFEVPDDFAQPVQYVKDRITLEMAGPKYSDGISKRSTEELLYTKHERWAYERERRHYVKLEESTSENGHYFIPFSTRLQLKSVYVGVRNAVPLDSLRLLLDNQGFGDVDLFRAALPYKWFEMVPQKVIVDGRDPKRPA